MHQLSIITQVPHSFCRCHCFDEVSTCPLLFCSRSSNASLRQLARWFFSSVTVLSVWKRPRFYRFVQSNYIIKQSLSLLMHLLVSLSLDQQWYFGLLFCESSLNFAVTTRFILWESLERKCNVTPLFTVYTPVSCFGCSISASGHDPGPRSCGGVCELRVVQPL